MIKRIFLFLCLFLIAGAYGCQGVGPGTGSGFQGGTEAGNPPTDGNLLGGTEAGNPPVGNHEGHDGSVDPRGAEGGDVCPDELKDEDGHCPVPEVHRIDQLTPEQMGMLHDHQQQQDATQKGINIKINPNALQHVNGVLGDFGHSETINELGDQKIQVIVPAPVTNLPQKVDPQPVVSP